MWCESEMVPLPPALEMAFFERNKVIEEPLETDSGSMEFSVNRERRETDRKGKTFLTLFSYRVSPTPHLTPSSVFQSCMNGWGCSS